MGLLTRGAHPLPWHEAKKYAEYVKRHGIQQFINRYNDTKSLEKSQFLWGDEIEYIVVVMDPETQKLKLSLRAPEILEQAEQVERAIVEKGEVLVTSWKPEYGTHMVEGTPGAPYCGSMECWTVVEPNMRARRAEVRKYLRPNEHLMTLTSYFLMGVGLFTEPAYPAGGPVTQSLYVPDEIINPHPRFPTLTANIRERRGEKVNILVPIMLEEKEEEIDFAPDASVGAIASGRDVSTNGRCSPKKESSPPRSASPADGIVLRKSTSTTSFDATEPNFLSHYFPSSDDNNRAFQRRISREISTSPISQINDGLSFPRSVMTDLPTPTIMPGIPPSVHMDCMAFGMGMCCLQVTLQTRHIGEARFLYDQLAVLCPIFLALTAATPILRGYLVDTDARWHVISASVDDRTVCERSCDDAACFIPKSRYDSISTYICSRSAMKEEYNDIPLVYNKEYYQMLRDAGIDHLLARHIAHLFIRDPLVVYEDRLEQNDASSMDHFENIQSTNWQTMRFKPPPIGSDIGWRVEFRVMEVQLTDFENAAFSVFLVLLTRVMLALNLDFYIPISKVDINMARGHLRDAVLNQKFYFRRNVFSPTPPTHDSPDQEESVAADIVEMSIDEIMNGSVCGMFPGLVPIVRNYLRTVQVSAETSEMLERYMTLISKRASGELMTSASFMRAFVRGHEAYQQDSRLNEQIAWDLMEICRRIGEGEVNPSELLGNLHIPKMRSDICRGALVSRPCLITDGPIS
eukprot:ANDGO_04407.mRNA.1 Glutamate--cysteine ligase